MRHWTGVRPSCSDIIESWISVWYVIVIIFFICRLRSCTSNGFIVIECFLVVRIVSLLFSFRIKPVVILIIIRVDHSKNTTYVCLIIIFVNRVFLFAVCNQIVGRFITMTIICHIIFWCIIICRVSIISSWVGNRCSWFNYSPNDLFLFFIFVLVLVSVLVSIFLFEAGLNAPGLKLSLFIIFTRSFDMVG